MAKKSSPLQNFHRIRSFSNLGTLCRIEGNLKILLDSAYFTQDERSSIKHTLLHIRDIKADYDKNSKLLIPRNK